MSTMAVPPEPPHVLAVDDSIVDRAVISRLLRSSKYQGVCVRALKIAMSGYDLLKRVKETAELREIPVVIMSSENSPARIRMCLEEGAEDFLIKPVRPSDVSRLCSRLITR
nr:unnamed protein product [Digitaria exilis]